MVIRRVRFNVYLLGLLLLTVVGCGTTESRRNKQLTKLGVHLEVTPDPTDFSQVVPIYRAHPTMITVQRNPFLKESDVAAAGVIVDASGGFALSIQFDQHGRQLLEQYTAMNPGKRLAVHAQFGEKMAEQRWLAAPLIQRRISDGVLSFTPDATRAETDEIALGLNNEAVKHGKLEKTKSKSMKTE